MVVIYDFIWFFHGTINHRNKGKGIPFVIEELQQPERDVDMLSFIGILVVILFSIYRIILIRKYNKTKIHSGAFTEEERNEFVSVFKETKKYKESLEEINEINYQVKEISNKINELENKIEKFKETIKIEIKQANELISRRPLLKEFLTARVLG